MKPEVLAQAKQFAEEETAFHLGFLPTEQSNPISAHVDADFARATADGVKTLLAVDAGVVPMAERVLASDAFQALADAMTDTLYHGGTIVFSGCGATGRVSIILETMWRRFFAARHEELTPPERQLAHQVKSIMTGGDYALIKSVESFEDYAEYGRRQVRDLGINGADMLVAITEGGETSSVLGTLAEAADRDAKCFLLFNNPAELLAARLERCRQAIENPKVTVLDLFCGPMAIAGSTRMQATTAEQLIAGAALEIALGRIIPRFRQSDFDFAAAYRKLLADLNRPEAVAAIADYIDFETDVYRRGGKITYFADDYLLDIFTDTTERSPTFMLPPFRNMHETALPQSWAFVKNPLYDTRKTWAATMHRMPRCLEWKSADYRDMNAPAHVAAAPPAIRLEDLLDFPIGNEGYALRLTNPEPTAVCFSVGSKLDSRLPEAFHVAAEEFRNRAGLHIGNPGGEVDGRVIPVTAAMTPLRLFEHLAVKLVLNNISTGTMVKLGRVAGNWMSWVSVSNKKLMDRGIRLVADLGKLEYFDACCRVFEAVDELNAPEWAAKEKPSPVQHALRKLGR